MSNKKEKLELVRDAISKNVNGAIESLFKSGVPERLYEMADGDEVKLLLMLEEVYYSALSSAFIVATSTRFGVDHKTVNDMFKERLDEEVHFMSGFKDEIVNKDKTIHKELKGDIIDFEKKLKEKKETVH